MSEQDFNTFLEKCEDQILVRVILAWKLVDEETLRRVYQEKQILPPTEACKLGQYLLRKRLIHIQDYTKAMMVVKQQAQVLYQKSFGIPPKGFTPAPDRSGGTEGPDSEQPTQQAMAIQEPSQPKGVKSDGQAPTKFLGKPGAQQKTERPSPNPEKGTPGHGSTKRSENVGTGTKSEKGSTETKVEIKQEGKAADGSDIGQVGSKFGNYEIISEIARGGMGIVYKAKQLHLNRIVALKVLLSGGAASEIEVQRFRREAESAGSLQHPNIVSIYEIGEQDGYHYFTMDYIEGETLQSLIKKKAKRKLLLQILEKVAHALEHAHQRGIIHRDIKPSNILVSKEMEPKITDFGLAKKLDASTMLTESGATLGTPFYMAPEQTLGQKDIDRRADIYSMGVMLYEILTNRLPFNAGTLVELYHKVVEEDPVPPSRLGRKVDRAIELVCLKCMEKDPKRRYQTAEELAEDIKRYLSGEAVSARKSSEIHRLVRKFHKHRHLIMIGLSLLVLAVFVMFLFLFRGDRAEQQKMEARMHLDEAKIMMKSGNFTDAVKELGTAISIYPQLKEAYIAYGEIYLIQKEYYKALTEYDRVLKLDADYAPAYHGKGRAYVGVQALPKAIEQFSLAIKHNPEYIEAYVARANAYHNRGSSEEDMENAIRDHEKADKLKKATLERGDNYFKNKDYSNALFEYDKILNADNKYFLAYFGKGKVYLVRNQYDLAVTQFTSAIEIETEFADLYAARAEAYEKRGKSKSSKADLDKAQEDYEKAKALKERKK